MRHREGQSGFTLLEVIVSLTLIAMVFGCVLLTTRGGLGAFRASSAAADLNARSARTMNRIVREFLAVGKGSLSPDLSSPVGAAPLWSSSMDYQAAFAWDQDTIVWGALRRLAFEMAAGELENGEDDNGNGLIDEGSIVLIENPGQPGERRVVFANGVSRWLEGEVPNGVDDNGNGLVDESGLAFDFEDEKLTVRISMERVGPDGRQLIRTLSDSVALRN